MNTFGFFGTYLIIAERRGNEDFIIGDSYPSFQMARTDDGNNVPMLNYYPISPDRVIILAVSDISSFLSSPSFEFSSSICKTDKRNTI